MKTMSELLLEKNEAHAAKRQNLNFTQLQNKWKELCSRAQKELRCMENDWWSEKARQIQGCADSNEMQKFYEEAQLMLTTGTMRLG